MKRGDATEFAADPTRFIDGDDTLVIERDDRAIGYYVPAADRDQQRVNDAVDRLDRTVRRILAETGMTEDELARLFDLTQPLLDDLSPDALGSPYPCVSSLTRARWSAMVSASGGASSSAIRP